MDESEIRILHVDDDPSILDVTGEFLQREDGRFRIETATTPNEGFDRIKNSPPDCIVSDYDMPRTNGIEFLRTVRETYPDLPFVLFTGKGSESVASEAMAAGVTDYLQKGAGTERYELLANRIKNAVEAQRAAQEVARQEELMRLTELAGNTGGWELDLETETLRITEGTRRLAGLSPDGNLRPEEALELYHPADRDKATAAVKRTVRTGEKTAETLRLQPRDTEGERLVDVTMTPVTSDGESTAVRGVISDVTDIRDHQRELRLLQQAIDDANVPITLSDPSQEDNPLVYVNNAYEELTGYSAEEAVGRNCRILQGENTDPEVVATLREAIDNEEPVTVELCNYRKDGTEFRNRLTVTPIYDDSGSLVRYLGTQQDVTDLRERQRELESERRFIEQSLDALDDLFYVLETDGTIRRWNDRVVDVTGYTASELEGMDATEMFPEDQQEEIADTIGRILPDGTATFEADLRTADGEQIPYEWTGARLTGSNGETTGIVGIGRDLRERRQRERRFQALVEGSSDIISIVDADGRFRYQSPSVERILGYDADRTVGDMAWEYMHPDDRDGLIETFEEWKGDAGVGESVEYRARHADGSWRWFEGRGTDQFENPAVDGYVINSRDITVRKESEQQLAQTQELLSEVSELADIGAWEYDAESETLTNTAGTRRIYGLESDTELTLSEAFERFHPDDRARLRECFEECLETGKPYEIDVRVITGDDHQRWLTAKGERIQDGDAGTIVRGYLQDVTEQKTREQQLIDLNETAQRLSKVSSRQDVADIGAEAARDILGLKANALHFVTGDGSELVPAAQTAESVSLIGDAPTVPVDDSIAGRVYRDGEPTAIRNVQEDPDLYNPDSTLKGHLYFPLGDHGVLIAGSTEVAAFDSIDITVGEVFAETLVAALNRIDRAETAKQHRERLALFFEESPVGAVQWDEQFRFERLNERAKEVLGYSESELRGESWETIVADADRKRVGDVVEQLLQADGGTQIVNKNITRNGEVRTCEWHNRAVTGPDGEVRAIFSKFRDVADRERRKQQLEEYETVLKALSDAVYVVDENGQFTYVNDEFVELVGYDRETILGNTPSLIKNGETVELAEEQLARLLSEDGPETVTFEATIEPRTGDPIVCEDHMGVLPYDGDSFTGSVGTLRDVSNKKERNRKLKRQNKRLEEFTSVVSHDLRNPLRTAAGRLELAQEECDSAHLDGVDAALKRSQALIEDLLRLARSGDSVGRMEPVSLSALARDCWSVLSDGEAGLAVETDQTVRADQSRLRQLFENLFANAVEHGGEDVTVRVGDLSNGFYVADDGVGIPVTEREDIFGAGYSTAEEGTGFGLRIVKQVIDAHGWEIRVTNSADDGARMEITEVDTPE
jgi:PAS domain S-box-containing protein